MFAHWIITSVCADRERGHKKRINMVVDMSRHTCERGEMPDHQVPSCFSNTRPSAQIHPKLSRHPWMRFVSYHVLKVSLSAAKVSNSRPQSRRSLTSVISARRSDHRDGLSSMLTSMSSITKAAILSYTHGHHC